MCLCLMTRKARKVSVSRLRITFQNFTLSPGPRFIFSLVRNSAPKLLKLKLLRLPLENPSLLNFQSKNSKRDVLACTYSPQKPSWVTSRVAKAGYMTRGLMTTMRRSRQELRISPGPKAKRSAPNGQYRVNGQALSSRMIAVHWRDFLVGIELRNLISRS